MLSGFLSGESSSTDSTSMAAIALQQCSASKHVGHYQNYAPCSQSVRTRRHVAATHPWDMFSQHFNVCANFVIMSLLHVASVCSTTCPCNMTPLCLATLKVFP